MINGGWKSYFGLENNCKATNLVTWDKKKLLFETLVTRVILCEVWGCIISRESWRKIEQIQKRFITYNLKIKKQYTLSYSPYRSGSFPHREPSHD